MCFKEIAFGRDPRGAIRHGDDCSPYLSRERCQWYRDRVMRKKSLSIDEQLRLVEAVEHLRGDVECVQALFEQSKGKASDARKFIIDKGLMAEFEPEEDEDD